MIYEGSIVEKLSSLKLGDHACFSIKDRREQIGVSAAFLKIGLERGERCLFLGDPVLVGEVHAALERLGIAVEKQKRRGALILSSARDYLVNGRLEPEHMIGVLLKAVEEAVETGFEGLRATGDVLWELGTSLDLRTLLAYEPALDACFAGKKLLGLCQYREECFPPKYLRNMLYSHAQVVRNGKTFLSNPYHNCVGSFEEFDFRAHPLEAMYEALK